MPRAAVFPGIVDEVSAVLRRLSARLDAAVVPWGGGVHMGLGCVPKKVDVVLGLGRLESGARPRAGRHDVHRRGGHGSRGLSGAVGSSRPVPQPGSARGRPRHHRRNSGGQYERPASPPLRNGAGPAHRPPRRGCGRHGDEGRGQGRQERHRLRYEQTLRRLAGYAGCDRRGDVPALPRSGVRAHLGGLLSRPRRRPARSSPGSWTRRSFRARWNS